MHRLLPIDWRPDLGALLPADPAVFAGPALCRWIVAAMLALTTLRSLIHIFAADGGAQSIATIDTSVAGGRNIIGLFGQWGAMQLLLAALEWVLWLRYPGLTPLILCALLAEPFLRALSSGLKPIETLRPAPGHRFNWAPVPFVALALYMALCPAR